jgi:hypothetical protein
MIDGDERGCGGVVVFTRCRDSRKRQEQHRVAVGAKRDRRREGSLKSERQET